MSRPPTIGIDVGATKINAAVVAGDGTVLHRHAPLRFNRFTDLVGLLVATVHALRAEVQDVAAVGVGVAGLVDFSTGRVGFAANHAHGSIDLRDRLAEECELPVVVDNDANAAAWAESVSGPPNENLLFLAVGTGLGSGFVVEGKVLRSPGGRGYELGHMSIDRRDDTSCPCGRRGCVELSVSGLALKAAGQGIVERDAGGLLAKRIGYAGVVTPRIMIDAAQDGDPDVVPVVEDMGRTLGLAVANVMSLIPVDRVAVGGGLSALRSLLMDPMVRSCADALGDSRVATPPRIARAAHARNATFIGAARLAGEAVSAFAEAT